MAKGAGGIAGLFGLLSGKKGGGSPAFREAQDVNTQKRVNEYARVQASEEPVWKRSSADIKAGQYVNSGEYRQKVEDKAAYDFRKKNNPLSGKGGFGDKLAKLSPIGGGYLRAKQRKADAITRASWEK